MRIFLFFPTCQLCLHATLIGSLTYSNGAQSPPCSTTSATHSCLNAFVARCVNPNHSFYPVYYLTIKSLGMSGTCTTLAGHSAITIPTPVTLTSTTANAAATMTPSEVSRLQLQPNCVRHRAAPTHHERTPYARSLFVGGQEYEDDVKTGAMLRDVMREMYTPPTDRALPPESSLSARQFSIYLFSRDTVPFIFPLPPLVDGRSDCPLGIEHGSRSAYIRLCGQALLIS